MSEINLSIIIPHYDIPDLLVRCVLSIPKRDDIQIIVIDDGSPDASHYLEKYPELCRNDVEYHTVRHRGRSGIMRNIGMSYATGKWITFVDADDFLVSDASEIFDFIISRQEDIIYFDASSFLSDDITKPGVRSVHYLFEQYNIDEDETPFRFHMDVLWGKMFKRDFLMRYNISCDNTKYATDSMFSLMSGYYADRILIVDRPLYCVTEREGSLAASLHMGATPSLFESLTRLKVALNKRVFAEKHEIVRYRDDSCFFIERIRRFYPLPYVVFVASFLFIHPSYVWPYIKRDARFVMKVTKALRKKL